jgi:ATP-binding cassette subfamily B protein
MSDVEGKPVNAGSPSNSDLVWRLLGLAWRYRLGCVKVISLQLLLLALGLLGLGFIGIGIDHIRYELHQQSSVAIGRAPDAVGPDAAVVVGPKPPRWPAGIAPPDDWSAMHTLAVVSLAVLCFALLRSLLNMVYTIAVNRLVQGQIVVALRAKVYDKMQRLSFRFFDENASGSIINRVTGDVQAVRSFVDGVVMQTLVVVLSLGVYLVYMVHINVRLTLACLATTPLLWALTRRFSREVRPAYERNRELADDQVRVISENLNGIHVVKGFARENEQIEAFDKSGRAVRDQRRWIFRKISVFSPLIGYLTNVNLAVMLAYGGYLVVCHERAPDADTAMRVGLSVGELIVFTGLLQQLSNNVSAVSNIANTMQQCLTSARRVFQVLDAPIEIQSPANPVRLPGMKGAVTFERVGFSYRKNDPVLADISLEVKAGQLVAILGATGSGKSTLLSLVPRFYDPDSGRVVVDGHDARRLDLDCLRRSVGIVFQESFLFSNTVAANIAFGHPEASPEQVLRAAKIAAAHDFIMQLPKGYETVLREGGGNLSGGQRQRLAIARAILLEPAILLLDDPTAAVDPETEDEIMRAMDSAMEGRTTLIVAHRLSTLRRADYVVVLDQGRIVQVGTHEELIQRKGQYRRAAKLQLPDPEDSRTLMGEGFRLPEWDA